MAQSLPLEGEDRWKLIDVSTLRGLDLSQDSEDIGDEFLLRAENMVMYRGALETDFGVKQFRHPVLGDPRRVHSIQLSTGIIETFLITDLTVCRKTSAAWVPVGTTTATTLNANESAASTAMDVVSTAGFSNGDVIGIQLDDGTYHITTVNGAPAGGVINITTGLPSGATSGNAVVKGVKLAGASTNPVDAVSVPFSDEIIFTNGIDNVKVLNGGTFVVSDVPDLPTNTKCVSVAVFDNRVFIINTQENGVRFSRRFRYCAAGDTTDWTTANDAGSRDLYDREDDLLKAFGLGPYLIIYRTNSIVRVQATNQSVLLYDAPNVVTGTGIFSIHGVIPIGKNLHALVGLDNIYTYNGGFGVEPIGDNIAKALLGAEGRMEKAFSERLFLVFDSFRKLLLLFYADSSATAYPNKVFIYHVDTKEFTERDFKQEISGWGETFDTEVMTWNDLVGSWLDQNWKWGGTAIDAGNPVLLLCAPGDDTTLEYGSNSPDDDGSPIVCTVETKDYSTKHMTTTLDNFISIAAGSSVEVLASKDKGASYTSLGSKALSAVVARTTHWKQISFRAMRFRIQATGYFRFPGFAFKSILDTEY